MDMLLELSDSGTDVLADTTLQVLRGAGLTFAAAESCTGGLVCARLTCIAGSSDVVAGGVVSYSNEVKMKVLGVKEESLAAFGAVSEPVATQMAEGVRRATGADIAVSVTGIAGPGGATAGKPVGTVCFGVSSEHFTHVETKHFDPSLSRAEIRMLASDRALNLAVQAAESEVHNA